MSIYRNLEVTEFSLGELVPKNGSDAVEKFKLKNLKDLSNFKQNITEKSLRQERSHESASAFNIDGLVRDHRGLKAQEEEDLEGKIASEVSRRVELLRDKAYEAGFEKGLVEGSEKAHAEAKEEFELKLSEVVGILSGLQEDAKKIHEVNMQEVYRMVKNLTKWVILKEVDEKYYLARLLEKLIHEINSKSNLVLRVNENTFGYMPEIIKIVERKVGELTNTRIEVDLEMKGRGIILEAENSIIDGSLESQLNKIDSLFRNVGKDE